MTAADTRSTMPADSIPEERINRLLEDWSAVEMYRIVCSPPIRLSTCPRISLIF
jgi:hypothetical protein